VLSVDASRTVVELLKAKDSIERQLGLIALGAGFTPPCAWTITPDGLVELSEPKNES
jgi:hypothetical protein